MSFDFLYEQALRHHEAGNFDEAEALFRKLLAVNPDNPDLLNLLGLIGQEKGADEQAVELFYKAIKLAPEFLPYKFNLALSLEHLGKDLEAISYYNQVPIKESFNNIGRIYYGLGKIEAAGYFCKALEMDAGYTEAQANLAMTYEPAKAMEALQKIKDPLAYGYLARLYVEAKDWHKALEYAVQTKDNALIGAIYAELGEADKAKDYLKRTQSAPALVNRANIAANEGKFAEAEKLYKQALDLRLGNLEAHLNYGQMLYKQGRAAEALEQYRQAVHLNPASAPASNNLGVILKDTGDYNEALGLFFNALALQPEREEYAVNASETLLLYFKKEPGTALKIAKNWVKCAKNDVFAVNTLRILQGKEVTAEYTHRLFEQFAENYEEVLERIEYNAVKELKKILGEVEGTVLDLGCGTGLAGKALKNDKNRFIGVDLSGKMLAKAASSGVYEELVEGDILEVYNEKFKNSAPNLPCPASDRLSMIIAMDVFNYFKELKDVLKVINGVPLAFSIEAGKGKINGRYKHNPCQVEKLLLRYGFKDIKKYPLTLRIEDGLGVDGVIFLAKNC